MFIMPRSYLTLIFIVLLSLRSFASDERNIVNATLKSATIYRSGAELVHDAKAQLTQGNNEVVIDGISNNVDINSIQVKIPSSVTIAGIEFQNYYLQPSIASPRVTALQDSIERMNQQIEKIRTSITTTKELTDVLKANRDIKGSQTGLSVAELVKLMDYYKAKSQELQAELSQQNEKLKKSQEQLQRLNNQLQEEQNKNAKSTGRIVLQLNSAISGKYDFTVSYITVNAYWTPFYDIKVNDIKSPLNLVYKAKMFQTTGLDWKQVKLSLSTATPSQFGNAPNLQTWFLAYINPYTSFEKALQDRLAVVAQTSSADGMPFREVTTSKASSNIKIRGSSIGNSNEPYYIVNGVPMSASEVTKINPNSIKKIDVLKDDASTSVYGARGANGVILITLKDGLEDYITISESALNITFDIDLPYDIASNGKEQTAVLKETDIAVNYKYYAVPKLDKDAYLLAEITNWQNLNLLPGDANIIFEGTYVGKSFIDPNTTTDTLNLTLGKDKRLSIKKEKLADFSSVKFLGSNKLQKITYDLIVKNNKKEAVNMLLKDQYPLSTNKEIEVELLESSDAMINPETGVLTWKLLLAPGESKKIRFSYSVKYPKDKTINLY